MLHRLKRLLLRLPLARRLNEVRKARRTDHGDDGPPLKYPNGHFYSPVPDLDDIRSREDEIFAVPDEITGVDLRAPQQLELVRELADFYGEQPFGHEKDPDRRYHFKNKYFSYSDGLVLYGMLRHLRPRRLIEVGSGYSSAAVLDVNEQFLDAELQCTFIEPYPKRLHRLLRDTDQQRHEVIERRVQDVDPVIFDRLGERDILFIDSTHVSKIGSDVNHLLFEVFPRLRSGVVVQVHDIFFPFEYPRAWVYEGRAWNEAYLLRALLTDNPHYRILLWNSYLHQKHGEEIEDLMPLWSRRHGGSIWLQRR